MFPSLRSLLLTASLLFVSNFQATAHGIAGNRLFIGTLAFDDPAVADELVLPLISNTTSGATDAPSTDLRINAAFARLLTPTLSFVIDSGWVKQTWPNGKNSGSDKTNIGIKYQAYRNNQHETLISLGLAWGIAHSGSASVGADAPHTIQPGLFIGKGFGDLPESFSALRPFAVTAAFVPEFPLGKSIKTTIPNSIGGFDSVMTPADSILHWGISLQYSTYYLSKRYTGSEPKSEPLNQFVPFVEFKFDSPLRAATAATMNPGLAYVDTSWQLAAAAVFPMNRSGGSGTGFRAQLLLFLDDVAPSIFGLPLLERREGPSQIRW